MGRIRKESLISSKWQMSCKCLALLAVLGLLDGAVDFHLVAFALGERRWPDPVSLYIYYVDPGLD